MSQICVTRQWWAEGISWRKSSNREYITVLVVNYGILNTILLEDNIVYL